MEEKRPIRTPKQPQKQKRDYVFSVTLAQGLCCVLVFLLLLLLSRGSSERAQGLRRDFALLQTRELQMQEIGEAVGAVREFFTAQTGTVAVMAQPDAETTAASTPPASVPAEPETEPTTAAATTTAAAKTLGAVQTAKTETKKTETKKTEAAVGGDDTDEASANEKTTLSLAAVTVPITRPVEGGRYTSYYGYRNNPITHQYALHTGLDIAVPQGTKIRAAYGGTVRLVGEDSRSGKYVTLTHDDGFETFYCHCSETLVTQGTIVRAGEAIACVGSTGWATGPHLHFEIRKNGKKLDPLQMLEHDV